MLEKGGIQMTLGTSISPGGGGYACSQYILISKKIPKYWEKLRYTVKSRYKELVETDWVFLITRYINKHYEVSVLVLKNPVMLV